MKLKQIKLNPSRFINALSLAKKALWDFKFQIGILAILGFISGLLEGIGINALIPLFAFIAKDKSQAPDIITRTIQKIFEMLHIPFNIVFLLLLIALLFIFKSIVLYIANYINIKITTEYDRKMKNDLFQKTLYTSWPFLMEQKIGYLEKVLMNDSSTSADLLINISGAILLITSLIMYVVVALNISATITLLTLCFGLLLFLAYKPIIYKSRVLAKEQSILNKTVSNLINENMIGIKTIKSSAMEDEVISKGKKYFYDFLESKKKMNLTNRLVSSFNQPIGIIFICGVFAFSYLNPSFNFISFMVIIYLTQKIFAYIETAQGKLQSVNELTPYLQSTIEFMEATKKFKENNPGSGRFAFNRTLEFKNITFSYSDRKEILHNINFSINKGEMIGLIGSSGSGKTTLVDLFLRLFDPKDGGIFIDGKNITSIDLKSWRKNIGYVSQDIFLLNDTIENNIRFYDSSVSMDQIEEASKSANIYDFIVEQPDTFNTVVGERGVMISAGQRQRIILARVLARKPAILILDEATSALDNTSELLIQKSMESLRGKVTALVIAHRLSTVTNSDKIIVLEKGKIIETGRPDDLLADPKSYFYKTYHLKENDVVKN